MKPSDEGLAKALSESADYRRGYWDAMQKYRTDGYQRYLEGWHAGHKEAVRKLGENPAPGFSDGVAYALENLEARKPRRPGRPKDTSVSRLAILSALAEERRLTVDDIYAHAVATGDYAYTVQSIRKQARLMAERGELIMSGWPRRYTIHALAHA